MRSLVSKLVILALYFLLPAALSWWFSDARADVTVPWYGLHLAWLGMIAATYLAVQWMSNHDR